MKRDLHLASFGVRRPGAQVEEVVAVDIAQPLDHVRGQHRAIGLQTHRRATTRALRHHDRAADLLA